MLRIVDGNLVEQGSMAGKQECRWRQPIVLVRPVAPPTTTWDIDTACEIQQDDGPATFAVRGTTRIIDDVHRPLFGMEQRVVTIESRHVITGTGANEFRREVTRREVIVPTLALVIDLQESSSTSFVNGGVRMENEETRSRHVTGPV